jgi:hypothetical protein
MNSRHGRGLGKWARCLGHPLSKIHAFMLVAMMAHSAPTLADATSGSVDANAPIFSFGGFGTLGAVHSSEDNAEFSGTTYKPTGAGYDHSWSAAVDSLIAAQVTANFTPKLSAVLQVISEQNYDASFTPHVEWANVKYQFTPDFSIRIGRTALPIFMLTDSRKIGYAIPWVRPPVALYDLVGVTSNDGVDGSYRMSMGAATNTLQVTAGRSDSKFPPYEGFPGGTIRARGLTALADSFEAGFATVRVTYGWSRVTIADFDPLFAAFRQFGPQGVEISDKYAVDNRRVTFVGMGASYDPGKWFVMGEWGSFDSHSLPGESTGWYVSGGPRLGKFTPYVMYSGLKADSNTSDPGLTVAQLPPYLAAPATELNALLNTALRSIDIDRTISAGLRWDVMKDIDLKLQMDHIRNGAGSAGTLSDIQPSFRPGGTVNLFSAAVDFVF